MQLALQKEIAEKNQLSSTIEAKLKEKDEQISHEKEELLQ